VNLRRITTVVGKALADPEQLSAHGAESRELDALTDGELLERFAQRHEEAAFAALLRRHGPMVLSVCRRVLRSTHDAEDAFQVTFLVMVEKAHRLRRPELLGNWLYGVAYRTALHARQRAARRSEREREAAAMSSDAANDPEIESRELRRVLDEELHRLPQKYRAPLVLCYLEGKTNEEAARLLGWPSGSMSYRLARGRELLRGRLQARLAGLTVLLPAIPLADFFRPAVVSPLLVQTTAQAAVTLVGAKMAAAATTGLISLSVRELMEATLHNLTPPRWRLWIAVFCLVLVALSAGGIGVWVVSSLWSSGDRGSCTGSH
jgi:RNA polymerase sigma factor (sigma-70 family)